MTGMRTGLAPRPGRVSTEAKGRLGCTSRKSSVSRSFLILVQMFSTHWGVRPLLLNCRRFGAGKQAVESSQGCAGFGYLLVGTRSPKHLLVHLHLSQHRAEHYKRCILIPSGWLKARLSLLTAPAFLTTPFTDFHGI